LTIDKIQKLVSTKFFFGSILVVHLSSIRFTYSIIIFVTSVAFGRVLRTCTVAEIGIREEEAVGNLFQSIRFSLSLSLSLSLCFTAAALRRYHQDHEEMRMEDLTRETDEEVGIMRRQS
jgi:hypothetical protein